MPITVRIAVLAAIVLAFPEARSPGRRRASRSRPTSTPSPTRRRSPDCASTCRSRTARRTRPIAPTSTSSTRSTGSTSSRGSRSRSPLRSTSSPSRARHLPVGPGGHVVGIDQAVWEPLDEHLARRERRAARPGLDVPARRDARRSRRRRRAARRDDLPPRPQLRPDEGSGKKAYRKALLDALRWPSPGARRPTTSPPRAFSRPRASMRSRGRSAPSSARDGAACASTWAPAGERTVFPLSSVAAIRLDRQTGTGRSRLTFLPPPLPSIFPGSVGTIAFGSFASPDYENASQVIPAVGTAPAYRRCSRLEHAPLHALPPAGTQPAGGWPVAIFGHGFSDSKNGAPWAVAVLARARRHRDDRDQRRRPRRRRRRHVHRRRTAGAAGDVPARRPRDRPGRQRHDRLDRGRERRRPAVAVGNRDGLRQTVDRPHAARPGCSRAASTSTATARPI